MNVSIILLALFCAIGGYLIGLNRGKETNKYDYDEGYEAGWNDCISEIEFVRTGGESEIITNPELIFGTGWDETREYKARELVRQLDELFDPECPLPEDVFPDPPKDEDIIDGGTY